MKTLKKIISEHLRYKNTIFKLAKSDLVKTYKGTALGWWWAIIRPSITLAVYYFAFTVGLKVSSSVGGYSYFLWLIAGFLPWFYMRDVLVAGAGSIKKYRFLVTKIKYPISTIPTFVSLSHLFTEIMLLVIVMAIFIFSGKMPDIYWLQLPFYMLLMFVFFCIWSLFAGILSTFSSDFFQLVKSVTLMLFWLSGIMYDVHSIDNDVIRHIMLLNPITVIVNGFRNSFIYKEWFWENPVELRNYVLVLLVIGFFAVTAVLLALTVFVYKKLNREVVDIL